MAKKKGALPGVAASGLPTTFKVNKVIPVHTAIELPTYYVNNVNIDMSSFDVKLTLGQIQGALEDNNLAVKPIALVYMSHQHFLALVNVMKDSAEKVRRIVQVVKTSDSEG